ncbi:DUF2612 domain-containing protein [Paenibacillus sp. 32352]|uniref:DUF2612 domain-containing protein n=1 Tax=Paenibacillus sp. 32352 TaxID=1969111 RepID=UPI0009ABB587|nr:DUF2612 domain-containing protein [Paenibacillus sp. 32352]
MITAKDIISRLTDVFTKDPNSNLGKLLSIMADQIRKLEETQSRIREWRDIDKAQGTTLDRIGTIVNQPRGVATDEVYRILIKSKIARNLSTGDINTIIRVLSTALNISSSEIQISEMYNDPVAPEPAAIALIRLPITAINESGIDPTQFAKIVQRTVAAGVRVGIIDLSGTFSFSSQPAEIELDPEAGFADVEQTTGGYLGTVYSPGQGTDLPI